MLMQVGQRGKNLFKEWEGLTRLRLRPTRHDEDAGRAPRLPSVVV
jgi:hypothetical protein